MQVHDEHGECDCHTVQERLNVLDERLSTIFRWGITAFVGLLSVLVVQLVNISGTLGALKTTERYLEKSLADLGDNYEELHQRIQEESREAEEDLANHEARAHIKD